MQDSSRTSIHTRKVSLGTWCVLVSDGDQLRLPSESGLRRASPRTRSSKLEIAGSQCGLPIPIRRRLDKGGSCGCRFRAGEESSRHSMFLDLLIAVFASPGSFCTRARSIFAIRAICTRARVTRKKYSKSARPDDVNRTVSSLYCVRNFAQ